MPDQEYDHNRDLETFKDWLQKQPHLPHDVDELLLRRFLHSCRYSIERAKRTIDLFFTVRSNAPELFCKRDPWAPEIRRCFEITDLLPLPNKTKENCRIFIYRLNNPDLDLFNFVDAVKTFFMLADTRLTEDDDIPSGEIPIFDAANVSLKFIGKVNLSVLRKYMMYSQIKFHEPKAESLYKDVPRELLPEEYGGNAGTIDQIKRYWIKKIEAKRDWFLTNDKRWAVDESLRPSNCKDDRVDQVKDLPGSFRTLALD
ncbi:hypothetical protein MSG28_012407 [Choristoneura fumiferana]|uniref:Uncharacterized protein n=1 Tax=Choristoneura fumiferana TaxID=7141 RepID=A0ACC0KD32_CHOFU|nr:hypothetical protein MSG28_012407 [Choristoneura fumiferana]